MAEWVIILDGYENGSNLTAAKSLKPMLLVILMCFMHVYYLLNQSAEQSDNCALLILDRCWLEMRLHLTENNLN